MIGWLGHPTLKHGQDDGTGNLLYILPRMIQPPTAIVHRRFEGTTTIMFRHTYYFKSKSNSKPIVNRVYIAIEVLYN